MAYFKVVSTSFYKGNKVSQKNRSEELVSRLRSAASDNNIYVKDCIINSCLLSVDNI
jgi:hypothetical protein